MSNKGAPFFSIVIPTYNRLQDLQFAFKSIEAQTFQNFEVIVVDNNSTDGTTEFLNRNDRIRSFLIQNDGIIGKSRNLGIHHAKGEYVCFLDSDDYWEKEKLEISHQYIRRFPNAVGFCHGEYHENRVSGTRNPVIYAARHTNLLNDLIYFGNRVSTSAAIIKREYLTPPAIFSENPKHVTCEDYYLWIQLAKKGSIIFIDQILGTYSLHAQNASNVSTINIRSTIRVVLESALENIKDERQIWTKCYKIFFLGNRFTFLFIVYLIQLTGIVLNRLIKK